MVWCASKTGHKETFETFKTTGEDFNHIQSAVYLNANILSHSFMENAAMSDQKTNRLFKHQCSFCHLDVDQLWGS